MVMHVGDAMASAQREKIQQSVHIYACLLEATSNTLFTAHTSYFLVLSARNKTTSLV